MAKWVKVRDANMSADTGIFVEETASTVVGGCVNASDRFIDGFYWLPAMARTPTLALFSRRSSLLPSASADVRSSDDVIAF